MTEMTCNAYDVCCTAESVEVNVLKRLGNALRNQTQHRVASFIHWNRKTRAAHYLQGMSDHDLRDIGMDRSRTGTKPALDLHHQLLMHRNWI